METLITAMAGGIGTALAGVTPAPVIAAGPLPIDQWPPFGRYLIELRPGDERAEAGGGNHLFRYYPVIVSVIVIRWHEFDSLYGIADGSYGLLKMLKLVRDAVNGADLGPVFGGREGTEVQRTRVLTDNQVDALNARVKFSSFYRIGEIAYEGESYPLHQVND